MIISTLHTQVYSISVYMRVRVCACVCTYKTIDLKYLCNSANSCATKLPD